MAGLYVTLGKTHSHRIQSAAQRLVCAPTETLETILEPNCAIAWVSHDPAAYFAPAFHPATGVRVITAGRVAWNQAEWQHATTLTQYRGGLSNRLLLDRYLQGGIAAIERHNGSAVVIVWDPRTQTLHALSDHMGFYPLYLYQSDRVGECVISTFADAIADDPAVNTTPDPVSMAEFLREWKITPPHTYYQEIKWAGAATHHVWNLANGAHYARQYWQPFQEPFFPNFNTAVDALTEAVYNAIQIRTLPHLGPIATYISGGMDSRVIPFAAYDPSLMYGVNLYDIPNREAAISKQICDAAGVQYVGYAREADYYSRWMRRGVEISGAMWSAEDNHFLGTLDIVQQAQTVLAAFPVDDLFKGACLEQRYVSIFGRNLPFFQFDNKPSASFLMETTPHAAPPEFAAQMQARLEEWFGELPPRLRRDRDRLHLEDKRVRPACYQPGLSDNMMFRAVPYDIFLADRAIVDCYSRTRPQWKINARLWHQVVVRLCGDRIVDANRGWRPGASRLEKLWVFGQDWIERRLIKPPQDELSNQGSWSNLGWYARHSASLRQQWYNTPQCDRELIKLLWGEDPWQTPLVDWANAPQLTPNGLEHDHSPYTLFRILTLLHHWSIRRQVPVSSNLAARL